MDAILAQAAILVQALANLWDVLGYFVVLGLFGAFGGFVADLDSKNNYRLRPVGRPEAGKPFELGWLGGVLTGIAAAIGIMLIGDTFGVIRGQVLDALQILRLAALALIAGFTGHSLLGGLSQKLADIARKQMDQQAAEIRGCQKTCV